MQLYMEQIGGKAGNYKVELKKYDDSTAAAGSWDDAQCTKNANDHVANANEVAVMGTFNSGCAKIEAPILNQAAGGPMLMVSHANTNPGLTKDWDPGEPAKYFPTGKRSYARVVTTDDLQGPAAAQFAAKDLKVTKCFVLDDTETYGKGVANTFAAEAQKQGITVVGRTSWKKGDANYTALFGQAKAAGADCVFFGGIYDNNGGQLVKDKVAVLGDNTLVKLIAPDGFTGYPEFNALPQAAGAYLTFAGLSTDVHQGGRRRAGEVPRPTTRPSTARTRPRATRSTACRPCRSSWPRSRSPTAPGPACATPSSRAPASPSRPTRRSWARPSRSTRPPVTSTPRTSRLSWSRTARRPSSRPGPFPDQDEHDAGVVRLINGSTTPVPSSQLVWLYLPTCRRRRADTASARAASAE